MCTYSTREEAEAFKVILSLKAAKIRTTDRFFHGIQTDAWELPLSGVSIGDILFKTTHSRSNTLTVKWGIAIRCQRMCCVDLHLMTYMTKTKLRESGSIKVVLIGIAGEMSVGRCLGYVTFLQN